MNTWCEGQADAMAQIRSGFQRWGAQLGIASGVHSLEHSKRLQLRIK